MQRMRRSFYLLSPCILLLIVSINPVFAEQHCRPVVGHFEAVVVPPGQGQVGRLKVFKSLSQWFAELRLYRRDEKGKVVKERDHLMDATRYLDRRSTFSDRQTV